MKKLILITILAMFTFSCNYNYGEGERTGTVLKISKKGTFCQTIEGTLNVGGVSADSQGLVVPNTWNFTTESESIRTSLEEASRSGERVTLKYKELGLMTPCKGDTSYMVTEILTK